MIKNNPSPETEVDIGILSKPIPKVVFNKVT